MVQPAAQSYMNGTASLGNREETPANGTLRARVGDAAGRALVQESDAQQANRRGEPKEYKISSCCDALVIVTVSLAFASAMTCVLAVIAHRLHFK